MPLAAECKGMYRLTAESRWDYSPRTSDDRNRALGVEWVHRMFEAVRT